VPGAKVPGEPADKEPFKCHPDTIRAKSHPLISPFYQAYQARSAKPPGIIDVIAHPPEIDGLPALGPILDRSQDS
jgi:hypothetical protein